MAGLVAAVAAVAAASCTSILGISGDFNLDASGGAGPGGATSSGSSSSRGSGAGNPGGGGSSSSGMGGATGSSSGVGPGGGGGAGATGPITGHQSTIQVLDSVKAQTPTDFTEPGHTIEALTFSGGTWTTTQGTVNPNLHDQFEIDGVADGRYLLHVDHNYIWLDNRQGVNLSTYTIVRPTATKMNHEPVAQFDVTNMTPWVDGDTFEVFTPAVNAYVFLQDGTALNPPLGPGDSSVTGSSFWRPIAFPPYNLVTAADDTFVFHVGRYGLNDYTTILDYAGMVPVDMVDQDGTVFDVDATFSHVSQSSMFSLNADAGSFGATVTTANPAAANPTFIIDYQASPAALHYGGQVGATADLILASLPPTGTINEDFFFGNPFGWDEFVVLGAQADLPITYPSKTPFVLPGTGTAFCFYLPNDPQLSSGSPVKPGLSPLGSPKVDGTNVFATGTPTISATPKITWTPPTTGTVDSVEVIVFHVLDDGAGGTTIDASAPRIWSVSDVDAIDVPPGILTSGNYYAFYVVASSCPSCQHEKTPFVQQIPQCQAIALSNTFLVQ